MGKIFLFFVMVATAVCAVDAAGLSAHRSEVEGAYDFWFYEPEPAPDSTAARKPLVLFLHGASLCGNNLDRVKRYGTIDAIEKGRKIDAYVMAPQTRGAWKPERLIKLVEWAQEKYPVDSNRIYVLGMSLGGYGTLDFAASYPDKIAAAVGICGGATKKDVSGLAKLPLWIVHGTADRDVSVKQSDRIAESIARVDSARSRLVYDRVPGLNHGRPARMLYSAEVYDWLLAHSLADPGRALNDTVHFSDRLLQHAYDGLTMQRRRKSSKKK